MNVFHPSLGLELLAGTASHWNHPSGCPSHLQREDLLEDQGVLQTRETQVSPKKPRDFLNAWNSALFFTRAKNQTGIKIEEKIWLRIFVKLLGHFDPSLCCN